jgi:hypothetical protein
VTRYRFACTNHTSAPRDTLEAVQAKVAGIEQNPDGCYLLHTVQVEQEDGAWLPLHEHRAKLILAAPLRTEFDGLIKAEGTWSKEAGERASKAHPEGGEAWHTALGPHKTATLTADGGGAESSVWCPDSPPADEWMRYERWSARGLEAHGYVCALCRRLVQSG